MTQASCSLYARYVKEREGFDTVESPHGFLTYRVEGKACYIRDLYVLPDSREGGVASSLADQAEEAAKAAGCTHLTGTIDLRTNGHERSLRVLLAYGFELASSHEGYLVLTKLIPPGQRS